MPYVLGIDIADSHVSAAVCRVVGANWAPPEIVTLDNYRHALPSVLHVSPAGTFTVGDGSTTDGGRIAREFVRRIGDNIPMVVTGQPYSPQALAALLVIWVAEQVAGLEGSHPDHIVLSHPAGWGPFRKQLLSEALWGVGLADVTLLAEPVAAAESHGWDAPAGRTFGVYSLGGNDFATSVVRRVHAGGFELLGTHQGGEPLGASDFDEALARHAGKALGKHYAPGGLREECTRAREELTVATETDILGVPVTRGEFEEMIAPALRLTVDTLIRTVRLIGLGPQDLHGVVLAGSGVRTPLVADLIGAEFPCPVMADPDPQVTAAAGAALAACQILSPPAADGALEGYPSMHLDETSGEYASEAPELPPRPPVRITKLKLPRSRRSPSRLAHARGFTFF